MRPALALALCALAVLVRASAASSDIPWPSYCGEDRPIPPLDASIPVTLMQAQVIVRHGDRTPAFNHMCWVDNTAVWECDMSQLQLSSVVGLEPLALAAAMRAFYQQLFRSGGALVERAELVASLALRRRALQRTAQTVAATHRHIHQVVSRQGSGYTDLSTILLHTPDEVDTLIATGERGTSSETRAISSGGRSTPSSTGSRS